MAAFWLLGLINNSAYVIMIAGANDISDGSVGLVYFCAIFPTLLVKLTCPYWFHYTSYNVRMWAIAVLMGSAYTTVAFSSRRALQLLGVVFSALQGGLGEASCLAMCTFFDSRAAITFWSSGTGFAGVAGYTWVGVLHILLGFTFRTTLLIANATAVGWLVVYYMLLQPQTRAKRRVEGVVSLEARSSSEQLQALEQDVLSSEIPQHDDSSCVLERRPAESLLLLLPSRSLDLGPASPSKHSQGVLAPQATTQRMNWRERYQRTIDLWPYMVPLTLVYFAEYAMQSGTWTAIGFPTDNATARHQFYEVSNWCYQIGVFVSRSSGLLYQADRTILWIMPGLQLGLLFFFLAVAVLHFWYNWWLLVPCFITGLLGGAVYVNAFTLLSREVQPCLQEFSLAAASLADSVGIALADICGVLIQGCLFKANGLSGADFSC
ncbi:g10930 [Coccomyxa elongata]